MHEHECSCCNSEVDCHEKDEHGGCSCSGAEKEINMKVYIARLALAFCFTLVASYIKMPLWISVTIYIIAYLLAGADIVLSAIKNIFKGEVFDENFLMTIATVGAFCIGQYSEAVAVMLFFGAGELLQAKAVARSRKSIASLMDLRPDYANIKKNDTIEKVSPLDVNIGDIIIVKAGEKIPLDGIVISGNSYIDTSALTGESVPREIVVDSEVLSGSVNQSGILEIKVTKAFGDSTASKILNLVENASSKKAQSEKFITKFAHYYTPIVVFVALAVAIIPPMFLGFSTFSTWLYRALIFLIISCPCALVISIPISFFGGIGGASRRGILIKGANFLEALNKADTVIFDKTGTLTKGVFKVCEIVCTDQVEQAELLELASIAESHSNHPVALSIIKEYGKKIDNGIITDYTERAGYGITAQTSKGKILAGNAKLIKEEHINFTEAKKVGTVIYIALDDKYMGHIVISDEIKENSKKAIDGLKKLGIKNIIMLTGDNEAVAQDVASKLGIEKYSSKLLPQDKVSEMQRLLQDKNQDGKTVFVGDGINDAPVLALSDIGVAMGGVGSDAAIEAADIVLMNDDPNTLCTAIEVARKTRKIVAQNITFALGVKVLILALSLFGVTSMWFAIFADVGVALIALFNALRTM